MARDRRHVLVNKPAEWEAYTSHPNKIDTIRTPSPADPAAHAAHLTKALQDAVNESQQRRNAVARSIDGATQGIYVEFDSPPGVELKLESLENKPQGIEVVAFSRAVPPTEENGLGVAAGLKSNLVETAVVFVPEGAVKHFLERFNDYGSAQRTIKGERKHRELIERMATLRLATLRALWTDSFDSYPASGQTIWWEVWLRRQDGKEIDRLRVFAAVSGMQFGPRQLHFEDRIVTLLYGTAEQLASSIDILNDLAELQRAKESAAFFENMTAQSQAAWVKSMKERLTPARSDAPAICVLDTGVNRGHPLLEDSLKDVDCHAVNVEWGTSDHNGHGTESAGQALFGNLVPRLAATAPTVLAHQLESVKILQPLGHAVNPPDLYGAVMASAVSRVEIQAPKRRRAFSMAVTSVDERDRGQPTSWSAAIDALAAGRSFDQDSTGLVYFEDEGKNPHRLFLLSAGNVSAYAADHLSMSDTEGIHDPGQAWNALTVGAFTELTTVDESETGGPGWSPVATNGELSPYSTTSVTFARTWPIKPDVVFEGGNLAKSPDGKTLFPELPSLSTLSTYFKPAEKHLVSTCMTSAATAQVAQIAGSILAEYPTLWPETVRALIVDSAQWTTRMRGRLDDTTGKTIRESLVRRYGFGVPSLDRALRSAKNALTLVVQDTIHPFEGGKLREMHVHPLPWPQTVLASLGEQAVSMRVTLSYFIEPNPGRRGWKKRHRYASHGLRFEVKTPFETSDQFRKRINQKALDEDEDKPDTADTTGWLLGSRVRNKGSIHSDIWVGTAVDLASRGSVVVFPVSGWWKDLPNRDRSSIGVKYSLIVSLTTQATDVDIWTPVAQQVGIPITPVVEVHV